MAYPKFHSPFPRLELSLDDKKKLCRLAKQLVHEVAEGYERFLQHDHGQVDPIRYALVKEREDVRVYQDRETGPRSETTALHSILTVGTMPGVLDDAMYGVVNHTIEAMRIKSAYAKDTIVNGAVLATVLEPSMDKPFRSLTVKWGVKRLPLAMRAVSRNRDVVYVESVGTRVLSNGERIGFQLVHSIDFKYAQPLPSYVRAKISSCTLWRQQSPDRTHIFMKSFVDIPDGLLAPLIVRATADALVSVSRGMHVAQMKKLAWLMQRRRASVVDDAPDDPTTSHCCAVCGGTAASSSSISSSSHSFSSRSLGRSSSSSSSRAAVKSTCTICNRFVCATCRVRRELCCISQSDRHLVERRVAFCVPCLSVTDRVGAADIARDEIGGGRSAAVGPLSEIVRGCNSVTRFSYTSTAVVPVAFAVAGNVHTGKSMAPMGRSASGLVYLQSQPPPHPHLHHQGDNGKRRSMTFAAPVKPLPSPLPSPLYAASMLREASAPTPPSSKSIGHTWVRA